MTRKSEGFHRDLAEARSWASGCKAGGAVRSYAWTRGWWGLLRWRRLEIRDFLQQQKHSFSTLGSEFTELIKCPNTNEGGQAPLQKALKPTDLEQSISRKQEEVVGDHGWRFPPAKDERTQPLNRHAITTGFFFSGAPIYYTAERLPMILHYLDHYPLLHIHVDTKDIAYCRSGLQNSLGKVKEMGPQALLTLWGQWSMMLFWICYSQTRKNWLGDVIINSSLHCSNYEITDFRILRVVRKEQQSTEPETKLQLLQGTGYWDPLIGSFEGRSGKLVGLSGQPPPSTKLRRTGRLIRRWPLAKQGSHDWTTMQKKTV